MYRYTYNIDTSRLNVHHRIFPYLSHFYLHPSPPPQNSGSKKHQHSYSFALCYNTIKYFQNHYSKLPSLINPLRKVQDFPGGASGKESACQSRRHNRREFNPWVRKIPQRRKWQPAPVYSCLENPIDREAQWAIVHWVAKNWTQLKQFSMHRHNTRKYFQNHYTKLSSLINPLRKVQDFLVLSAFIQSAVFKS